jgi:hypothetical protein
MLSLVIGAYCEAIGMVMRIVFRTNPHSSGVYIVQYLFVVLSVSLLAVHLQNYADASLSHVLSWQAIISSSVDSCRISKPRNICGR